MSRLPRQQALSFLSIPNSTEQLSLATTKSVQINELFIVFMAFKEDQKEQYGAVGAAKNWHH